MVPDYERLRAVTEAQPAFSRFLGIELISFSRDRIEAELLVREEMANRNGLLQAVRSWLLQTTWAVRRPA